MELPRKIREATTKEPRKRAYEYSEYEMDVTIKKLYKCNYWEDPAYASKIKRFGLLLARSAALTNHIDRVLRGDLDDDDEE